MKLGATPPAATPAAPAAAPTGATLPAGVAMDDATRASHAALPDSSLPMLAPAGGTTKLLVDEGEVLPQLLSAIGDARRSVDLAMFSLSDSGAGKQVIDALAERAKDGVDVRVTIDQVGSGVLPKVGPGRAMVERMREAGIEVAVNNRIVGMRPNPVDHRKLLVIDDEVAFTGGMNLSKKFGKWHDVMVRIEGPAAAVFGAHFTDRWVDLGGAVDAARTGAASVSGGTATSGVPGSGAAGPGQARSGVAMLANHPGRDLHASDHLLENLSKASSRAWILTPTLSDPAVVEALVDAARRGVDARVAVSGPEGWIGTRALGVIGSTFYRELVNAGVKVYEQPGMSHAKVSLVDDVASVGSLNMTRRAMLWDHELMMASDEPKFVDQVEQLFTTDFEKSTLVDQERADSRGARVGEAIRKGIGLKW